MYKAFAQEVRESHRYGMNPDDYNIDDIDREIEALYDTRKRTNAEISDLDIRITASFFLFTTHLLEGRIRTPGAKEFIWKRGQPLQDDVTMLLELETAKDIRKKFQELQPDDPQYERLQDALVMYRELEKHDSSFPPITKKGKIKPGDLTEPIPQIRRKLQLTDMEVGIPDDSLLYDEKLAAAVMQFQRRHGLKDDGVIDSKTISFLNMTFKRKADIIELNLERLRWTPHTTIDHDAVVVNVPEYIMRVYHERDKKIEMRVVLGSEFNATPIFLDTLKYIVFSPTWNVPRSIFEEEFLPNLRNDPAYYSETFKFFKNGVEIDPLEEPWEDEEIDPRAYQAVQDPGESNSLGFVKFVMPNNFNIYLHDTPADRLFNRQQRALSHGCIRLEDPVGFAKYLLQDNDKWNEKRILEAMNSTEPVNVKLNKDYPVHIVYRTAWVDENDLINFREDIYNHDERQLAQLHKLDRDLSSSD